MVAIPSHGWFMALFYPHLEWDLQATKKGIEWDGDRFSNDEMMIQGDIMGFTSNLPRNLTSR